MIFRSCIVAVIVFTFTVSLSFANPTISLVPVSATGPHTIVDDEIFAQPGARVYLEIRIRGWDPDLDGVPTLRTWQAELGYPPLGDGYCSPGGPCPPVPPVCTTDAECAVAVGPGSTCSPVSSRCDQWFFDVSRPDYVFFGATLIITAGDPAIPTTTAGGTTGSPGVTDDGTPKYAATLPVDLPLSAIGTYTVSLRLGPITFLQDGLTSDLIPGVVVESAKVTAAYGRCCFDIGYSSTQCVDNVLVAFCDTKPGPTYFTPGATCAEPCPNCLSNDDCKDAGPGQQIDADNLCTQNLCNLATLTCANEPIPEWNPLTQCCVPDVGAPSVQTPINDDPCKLKRCSLGGGLGVPFYPSAPNGTECDDGNPCTHDDQCIQGTCEGINLFLSGDQCPPDQDCQFGGDTPLGFCLTAVNECECGYFGDGANVALFGYLPSSCGEVTDVYVISFAPNVVFGVLLLSFDPAALEIVDVTPAFPFNQETGQQIDPVLGIINYTVSSSLGGTNAGTTMAKVTVRGRDGGPGFMKVNGAVLFNSTFQQVAAILQPSAVPTSVVCTAEETDLDFGESVVVNPGSQGPDAGTDSFVEITNLTGPDDASVFVQDAPTLNLGQFTVFGRDLQVSTSLANGQFLMRVVVSFNQQDVAAFSLDPLTVDLLWLNDSTSMWDLAVASDTQPSPGHTGPIGDRFASSGTTTPDVATLSSDLGDYGVFWNTSTQRGFAWANVDHASDFAPGVPAAPNAATYGDDVCTGGTANGQPCGTHVECPGGSCRLKNRFVSFVPSSGAGVGIRTMLTSLDANSVADPGTYNGTSRWIGAPALAINDGISGAFNAAALQCAFHSQNWESVGLIHVYGSTVVPASSYDVEMCASEIGPCSAPLRIDTAKFGDVVTPVNTVNFQDVNSIVAKFQGAPAGPSKTRTKLTNSIVNPVNPINFQEVSACVSAFQSKAFKTVVAAAPAICP